MGIKAKEFQKEKQSSGNKTSSRERQSLLVFARGIVLWSHHAAWPLPLYGAAVIIPWVVVVGGRCGHHKHAGHIELYICRREGSQGSADCYTTCSSKFIYLYR